MILPSELIGSIPRAPELIEAIFVGTVRDTMEKFEDTGSPVIIDSEERKYCSFWTYNTHWGSNSTPEKIRNRVLGTKLAELFLR